MSQQRRLGDLVKLTSGKSPSSFRFAADGIPYFKVDQLGKSSKYLAKSDTPYFAKESPTVPARSVLIAKRGAAIALDRVRIIRQSSFMDTNVMALTPTEGLDGEYLFYWLAKRGLWDIADVTSVPQINNKHINPLLITLPPLREQRKVVNHLSDVDGLIDSLERLIFKKRAIKQGMMQELLTGRRRLQGFSKSWQATTFGDLVRIQRGSVLTRAQAGSGRIPVVAGGKTPAGYTDKANRVGRTITISASGASAGYVALYNEPIFASDCSTISSSRHYDLDFIYYSLLLRQDDIYRAQTGGAQPHIHACDVYPMEIQVPTDMQEQIAIAQVLVDADKEIMALERRLESARGIKQGMMQELLIGRTKLVPEGVR